MGKSTLIDASKSTLILNGTVITDFVVGEIITLVPKNPYASTTAGANGSVNINKRVDAEQYTLTINVLKYSENDVFLNSALANFIVFNGNIKSEFVRLGGETFIENWSLLNGVLTDQPTHGSNSQDGKDTVEYKIEFRQAIRLI